MKKVTKEHLNNIGTISDLNHQAKRLKALDNANGSAEYRNFKRLVDIVGSALDPELRDMEEWKQVIEIDKQLEVERNISADDWARIGVTWPDDDSA